MAKTKINGASADSKAPDLLSKAKEARVTKSLQSSKAKSKEVAKQVAVKEEKKSRKIKQPSPLSEDSDSEASDSDESGEKETKLAMNGKINGAASDSSEDSDSSDSSDSSDDEKASAPAPAPAANGLKGHARTTEEDSSDDSSEEEEDDDSEESDSEEEKVATKAVPESAHMAAASRDSGEDSDSDAADSDSEDDDEDDSEEETKKPLQPPKRKAEEVATPVGKKVKTTETNGGGGSNNLFVGNLSWNVDEEWLKSEFEGFGELTGVRIVMDRDTGRSKGFGYIEFANTADAAKAHAEMKEYELDGRKLNVDFATSRSTPNTTPRDKFQNRAKAFGDQLSQPSDTLFVGNLSFDVGQDALSTAFGEYGTIMSVRIPTFPDSGQPKGFGYVTFSSVDEAKGALEGLQGADIEGRSARLDYSQPRAPGDSSRGGRGGLGGRGGGGRGGFGDRGRGGRGGFGDRGGRGGFRGGARPNTTNRGGFGDFSGKKVTF